MPFYLYLSYHKLYKLVKLIYLIILIFVTYKCSVNVLQFLSLYLKEPFKLQLLKVLVWHVKLCYTKVNAQMYVFK